MNINYKPWLTLLCALAWLFSLDLCCPSGAYALEKEKPLASGREIVGTRKPGVLQAGAASDANSGTLKTARTRAEQGEPSQKQPRRVKETKNARKEKGGATRGDNVYAGQTPLTEAEVNGFLALLPRFRSWARLSQEEAHPILKDGRPDFFYSPKSAQWVQAQGWEPRRFFCVMGKLAAALVIVEEGNDFKGTRPADMPAVNTEELNLARRHLGELLRAGESTAAIHEPAK